MIAFAQPEATKCAPDLLSHKYRPTSIDQLAKCHIDQAQDLKQWILDFINSSSKPKDYPDDTDESDISHDSNLSNPKFQVEKKCALLTGPPGVGKTSLVYTIANELKLHVVESHPSEKRDFKLFSTLKLGNQKGKINPIAKLFQVAQQKQADHREARRKRRKLSDSSSNQNESANGNNNQITGQLSLKGNASIVLFDDIDVVFEEDGSFLKSLVEFIRESKRPVILTATQSIDFIKETIIHLKHIHLGRPVLEDCTQLIRDVCKKENYSKLIRSLANCRLLADRLSCDIRQCLNRIHFYGNEVGDHLGNDDLDAASISHIWPEFSRLTFKGRLCDQKRKQTDSICIIEDDSRTLDYYKDEDTNMTEIVQDSTSDYTIDANQLEDDNALLMNCYSTTCLVDTMNKTFGHVDKTQLLEDWLHGRPTPRCEAYDNVHELGERIKCAIVDVAQRVYSNELALKEDLFERCKEFELERQSSCAMSERLNRIIKGRIEPPDKEFYTDIVPMLGETIMIERQRRVGGNQVQQSLMSVTGNLSPFATSRRSRRIPSYLESIGIYLEPEDFTLISRNLLTDDRLKLEKT